MKSIALTLAVLLSTVVCAQATDTTTVTTSDPADLKLEEKPAEEAATEEVAPAKK